MKLSSSSERQISDAAQRKKKGSVKKEKVYLMKLRAKKICHLKIVWLLWIYLLDVVAYLRVCSKQVTSIFYVVAISSKNSTYFDD